jgi:2-polyprenyl-3-methyl-5-hydroxy-6-metoxy-1,4-benzoquinol methylase
MATATATATQVCDLCESPDWRVFATRGRYGLPLTTVICEGCGLVYTNPRPTDEEITAFYHDHYWGQYKNQSRPDEKFFQRRLPKIKAMLGELKPFLKQGAAVLEIGCSVGALLSRIRDELGSEGTVIGIEAHTGHAAFAREQKSLDVRAGLLHEVAPALPPAGFDLVVMNHVLEHTIRPSGVLQTIHELLKEGGHLVVEVPNVEAPGSSLSNFFHLAHNYAFSPATLARLARKAGFAVGRVEALDGDLPQTRLLGVFRKPGPEGSEPADEPLPADSAAARAEALRKYDRWYLLTAASLRKKVTHFRRHHLE